MAVSHPTAKIKVCRPGSGYTDGISPFKSLDRLDWSLTMVRWAKPSTGPFQDLLGVQLFFLPGSCACRTAHGLRLGGVGTQYRDLWEYKQECLLLGLCGSRTIHRLQLEELELNIGPFQSHQVCSQECFPLRPWTLRTAG